jgi:hypothetical protein
MAAALPSIAAVAIAVAAKTDLMLVIYLLPLGGLLLAKRRSRRAGSRRKRDVKDEKSDRKSRRR